MARVQDTTSIKWNRWVHFTRLQLHCIFWNLADTVNFSCLNFLPCTWVWSLIRVMEHEVKLLHLHGRHVFTAPYHLPAACHHFTSHFLLRHRFLFFPPLAAAHFDSTQRRKYQTNIKQKAAIRLPPRCSSAAPILKRGKKYWLDGEAVWVPRLFVIVEHGHPHQSSHNPHHFHTPHS